MNYFSIISVEIIHVLWWRKGRISTFRVRGMPSKCFFRKNPHSCKDIKTDVTVFHREIQKKLRSSRNVISGEM